MPGMLKEVLAPARTERYRRQIVSKIQEVRQGLSARRAAEFVHLEHALVHGHVVVARGDDEVRPLDDAVVVDLVVMNKDAARRLDRGTFGICEGCGEPISEKRLDAVPWAKFCIPCHERARRAEEEQG